MTKKTLSPDRIVLGQIVRDMASGFTGTAVTRSELFNGNIQFGVQPRMGEGDTEFPDSLALDHHLLEVIDDGISERMTPPGPCAINVGDKVTDIVTGVKGVAVTKSVFLNGCIYFEVQPTKSRLAKLQPDRAFVDHTRLKVVKKSEAAPKDTVRAPGGPVRRVLRAN